MAAGFLGLALVAHAFLAQGWNKRGAHEPCMYAPLHPADVMPEQGPRDADWAYFPFGVTCDWTGYSSHAVTSNATWLASVQFTAGLLFLCGAVGLLGWAAFGRTVLTAPGAQVEARPMAIDFHDSANRRTYSGREADASWRGPAD
jgi:hypothetical protein